MVEAVGSAVRRVKPGDHVVCSWNPHCGDCFYCDRDQPILCEIFTATQPRGQLMDGASRLRCDDGAADAPFLGRVTPCRVLRRAEPGAIAGAEASSVRPRLPDRLRRHDRLRRRDARSAPVAGRRQRAGDRLRRGGAGRACRARGWPARAASSPWTASQARLDRGERFGATRRHPRGRRCAGAADPRPDPGPRRRLVIESGRPSQRLLRSPAEACRPGGQVVFLGKVNVDQQVAFRWGALMGEKRIVRSSYGGARLGATPCSRRPIWTAS